MRDAMPYVLLGLFGMVMFFGLHGAACGAHVAAVEMYRAHGGDPNYYRWSYSYCRVVSAPLAKLMGG